MSAPLKKRILRFLQREFVLSLFFLVLIVLAVVYPGKIKEYPGMVSRETMLTLTVLLMIATGIKESGYFEVFAARMIKKVHNEKMLAFFLITISAVLSTFLTNDVALFIVVPLTLSLQKVIRNDISKLIIFEAIAVNVGSFLTPIGNPQNIFLWHKWGVSSVSFIFKTLPGVVVLYVLLIVFVLLVFRSKKIRLTGSEERIFFDKKLFVLSMMMLLVFIVSLETGYENVLVFVVFGLFMVFYRKVLVKTDWLLLLLFVLIFIDFHVISTLPAISEGVHKLSIESGRNVYLLSGVLSQFISNVPAGVFVSKFSNDWFAVVYGVNVGGNGLVFASLANVIAMRMAGGKSIWITFHKYSLPYLVISGALICFLFFC
ncbi:MAG: citrate transporter [Chlorobi bacterium]|nr:citrate transporter [Chlorobiota bacterium]